MKFQKVNRIFGELSIPGDKSISHRAIMFGALADGTTKVHNFLKGADCLSTIRCFRQLGIPIIEEDDTITIYGQGLYGLKKPDSILDVGNSGTTLRMISGILSGQSFEVTLTGDESIRKRPMNRIITPLTLMDADIRSYDNNSCAPIIINSTRNDNVRRLTSINYQSPVASAQVKSAVLLAGLYADGKTMVTEPYLSRNHTELMLAQFGVMLETNGTTVSITPDQRLTGQTILVPGDISSAAYFIAAACLLPNSEVLIKNVGVNKTRDGILRVLSEMGADITLENLTNPNGEATSDIRIRSSKLKAVTIGGSMIPRLIDEIPILAVLACFAEGETIIKDASELKVKESNRIDVMVNQLAAMGADIKATEDGMIIRGGKQLKGATISSKDDHRIAMSFAIASLLADGETTIEGAEIVNISYPNFYEDLSRLTE